MNNITMMSVNDIIPYANNPRNNKGAVDKVAASIREFGFKQAKRKYFSGKQFCAICGTTEKIQIHHIIPYRLTQDNSRENLIPLCVKHHKIIEYIGLDLMKADTDYERVKFLYNNILRERQIITYMKIKECQTVGDN